MGHVPPASASNSRPPVLITQTTELAALCQRLAAEPFVAIDTEFIARAHLLARALRGPARRHRRRGGDRRPRPPASTLAPLGRTAGQRECRQGLPRRQAGTWKSSCSFSARCRSPLFDTQVARHGGGFRRPGSATTAWSARLPAARSTRRNRFSDWSARPLSRAPGGLCRRRCHLASSCVRAAHRPALAREGRLEWVGEEMGILAEPSTYRPDPETMWERLRPRTTNRRMLGVLRAVAAWREREAQRINIPPPAAAAGTRACWRYRPARRRPSRRSAGSAASPRGFARRRPLAKSLIAAIADARRPSPEIALAGSQGPPREGPRPSPALVALLKVLLAEKAEAHDVAPKLLASLGRYRPAGGRAGAGRPPPCMAGATPCSARTPWR